VRVRLTVLIPAVAVATALTACGDSGVKKPAFVTKADASCAVGNSAISGVAKPSNAPQVAAAAGTATTTIDGQVASLRSMKMPGGADKKTIDGIIVAIGDVSGPTKALQDAATKNDEQGMAVAGAELSKKADAAATQAQGYGLAQCGTGLKPALGTLMTGTRDVLKASYVTRGEAACRDTEKKTNALPEPGASLPSLGRYLDSYVPLVSKLVSDLQGLPTPPGDEATIGDLHASLDALVAKIKEIGAAAKANNPRLMAALFEEANLASTQVNAKFDAYGLKACGSLSNI
jgi:hypothetical protein